MVEDFINFFGAFAIALWMSVDEHSVRTTFRRGTQGHSGVNAELACLIRCRRYDAALIPLTADNYGFAFQRSVEQFFYGDKEGIHIDVKDSAHWKRLNATPRSPPSPAVHARRCGYTPSRRNSRKSPCSCRCASAPAMRIGHDRLAALA